MHKIQLISFGMAHSAIHPKVDVLVDVRHLLPNPHAMFPKENGKDPKVRKWVVESAGAEELIRGVLLLLDVPSIRTLAIACHGGKHRSVALIEETAARYTGPRGISVSHLALPMKGEKG